VFLCQAPSHFIIHHAVPRDQWLPTPLLQEAHAHCREHTHLLVPALDTLPRASMEKDETLEEFLSRIRTDASGIGNFLAPDDLIAAQKYEHNLDILREVFDGCRRHIVEDEDLRALMQQKMHAIAARVNDVRRRDCALKALAQRLQQAEDMEKRMGARLREVLIHREDFDEHDTVEIMLEKALCSPVPLGYEAARKDFAGRESCRSQT
jgi:hypothetical protein